MSCVQNSTAISGNSRFKEFFSMVIIVLMLGMRSTAQGLTLANTQAKILKTTSAVIYWETDEPAYGQVEYGANLGLGSQTPVERLSYWHEIELAGLIEGQTYSYRIVAQERKGRQTDSPVHTFKTLTQTELDDLVKAARSDGGLPRTYYVNNVTGSDDNDGLSTLTAFATIQKAADTVDAGDACIVQAGNPYSEQVNVFGKNGIPTHRIRFVGQGWPEVHSTTNFVFGLRRNYISIEGFNIFGDGAVHGSN